MSALEEFQKSLSVLLESCEKYDRGYDGYDWKTIRGLLAITFYDGTVAADELDELRKSLAEKDAEIERLRARVEMLEDAISICVQFLTNTNTITDEMQVRLVKCLKDANRLDLADAIAVGGFASIVGEE